MARTIRLTPATPPDQPATQRPDQGRRRRALHPLALPRDTPITRSMHGPFIQVKRHRRPSGGVFA